MATVAAGCSDATQPATPAHAFERDFSDTTHGWSAGFANFPLGWEDQMELESGHMPLPAALRQDGEHGLYVAATNRSDDVFMYWKGRIDGLQPGGRYQVRFEVEFATNSPAGCVGIGGAPGESVYVKAGASPVEPEPIAGQMGTLDYWVMNVDKGHQSNAGNDALVLGNVATDAGDCEERERGMKSLAGEEHLTTEAADDGSLWLFVGTDSGFEGRTELYYTRFHALLHDDVR